MNLERIELYGFKSFADKAVIKFSDGITGIVGPNGCGKSNVADAIRWVLGEQSAKSLRGGSMQDVIFSGTQNRKSLSYCEVSLVFNNTNRIFSLEYDEVVITRKLFKSGESEYYINRQQSRLRDIVDLLHECGIGKEGYTIIGQGKVEEIMSAKPEDRRAIFEEATGIAKFKQRKGESERKLERVRENVLRFSDIIFGLEEQLAPLERQAEKTRQYRALSEELKYHELNTYVYKFENVANEKAKITTKIQGITEETSIRQREADEAGREYDGVMEEISLSDSRLNSLHEELLDKTVGIEKQEGAAKLINERISFLRSQKERTEKETEANRTQGAINSDLIKTNFDLKAKKSAEIENLLRENEELSFKHIELTNRLAEGESQAETSRKKILESMESLSDINLNKGSLGAERNALYERKIEFANRLLGLNSRRDQQFGDKEKLDKEVTDLDRAIYELKGSIAEKEDEVRDINQKVADVDNKIYNLNSNISMLLAKENFTVGLKESYEGYQPAVKRLMITAKDNREVAGKIKGVVAGVIRTDARYEIAVETALGAAAQNIITDTPDDAKYLIEYLKEIRAGRATFLPISSVKPRVESDYALSALGMTGAIGLATKLVDYDVKFENVIKNLLGNTLIVDGIENATKIANKYRFSFKIVTLEGDVFSTQGSMTGGSRRQDSPNLLAGDRQLDEIRSRLNDRRKEMDEAKELKQSYETERDKSTEELSLLNERYQAKKQELLLVREKLSVSETALISIGKEAEEIADTIEAIDEKIAKIDLDIKDIKSGSEKIEADKLSASTEADKRMSEYEALRKERDSLAAKITENQIMLASLNSEVLGLDSENNRLKEENDALEKAIKAAESSIANSEVIIENLKLDAEKAALSKEEQEYVENLRRDIGGIEEKKGKLRERLSLLTEKKQALLDEINALAEKKHNEEINLTKIDSDMEYSGQRIFEEYQETYETAVKNKAEEYDVKAGEAEAARIKRKINSLGSINPNAIDDYQLLKERYEEMNVQKEDLEKAEADLKQAIDTLKKEMQEKFDEGFKEINENFTRIFKELFGGGRALLRLDYTDVEDPLEAGIEIEAEPPGKKLQKLSLLSGGEKALTAIAILFSILKMRPMPFCVLDEVEAALDEANVDRFARYLKKFSSDTQFIVITHKKPTMELADNLFGVTMEEHGVSKMVSVKLSDIVIEEN